MKRNSTNLPKFGLRPDEVIFAFGSQKVFQECVDAAWLTPVVRRHKLTLFDHVDVARCWARIRSGERPPACDAMAIRNTVTRPGQTRVEDTTGSSHRGEVSPL